MNKHTEGFELFLTKQYNKGKLSPNEYALIRSNWEEFVLSESAE